MQGNALNVGNGSGGDCTLSAKKLPMQGIESTQGIEPMWGNAANLVTWVQLAAWICNTTYFHWLCFLVWIQFPAWATFLQ